jgi:glutaredoxin
MRAVFLFSVMLLVAAGGWLYSSARLSAADFTGDHSVVIFTAPWCGYCDRARAHLLERDVGFLEIDIEASAEANARWRDAGGRGVPLAFFEQQRVSGYSRPVYDQLMDDLAD